MDEGKLFRKLRKDRGLSLEQVSDELNSVSFISKFETGNSNISLNRMERLLENVNVSMEEFLYLRDLEKNPELNSELGAMISYLSGDFYYYTAKIFTIVSEVEEIGYQKSLERFELIKDELNPKINWQRFLSLYCEMSIIITKTNLTRDDNRTLEKVMDEIRLISKPVVSYLYKVEDWGVFEIILFKIFLITFKVEQINQLLPVAISRTKKESQFHPMKYAKLEIIFSSFSYFVNFRHEKWSKNSLVIARELLKDEKDLLNSTLLLFYEGWHTLIFEDLEKGSQSCYQALSIFKILDQPKMEKKFRGILKIILRNQKDPNSSAVFL